jgi:hypothetical protein
MVLPKPEALPYLRAAALDEVLAVGGTLAPESIMIILGKIG